MTIEIIFIISFFLITYALVGFPASLYILNKFIKNSLNLDFNYKPFVSVIIPAHNEERVIIQKLNNLINLDYPKEKIEIIIASDNSTDKTNELVEQFMLDNQQEKVILYKVHERKGKTNAQNEAVRISKGSILVFSDANSMLDKDAVIHLISSFAEDDIVYVTGRLNYVNSWDSITSYTENNYWNYDLYMRKIESDIKTITAGNGAIYAIKKEGYIEFDPIKSHDSAMPIEAAINKKRAIYNENAIAFEKAGETTEDEFKRKIRMNRMILTWIFGDLQKYNILKCGWFSYFYFGHRTLRYSLFILHSVFFIANIMLINIHPIYVVIFILQIIFIILALVSSMLGLKSKLFYYPYYYGMTIVAQAIGAFNQITGRSKPFWEKANTTR